MSEATILAAVARLERTLVDGAGVQAGQLRELTASVQVLVDKVEPLEAWKAAVDQAEADRVKRVKDIRDKVATSLLVLFVIFVVGLLVAGGVQWMGEKLQPATHQEPAP